MQFFMAQRVNRDVRERGEHVLPQNLFMPDSSNFFFCFKTPGYNLEILSSVGEQLKGKRGYQSRMAVEKFLRRSDKIKTFLAMRDLIAGRILSNAVRPR